MKFIIPQSTLNKALTTCSRALNTGFILATSCYRFKYTDTLEISTCNMEISICQTMQVEANDPFDILIPGEQLKRLIASLPDQALTISAEQYGSDAWNIKIKSANGTYELVGHDGENLPTITTEKGNSIELNFEDLSEAMFRTSYTRLSDTTDNALNGLQVGFTDKGISFAAFNGVSFALFNLPGKYEPYSLLLPNGIVLALLNLTITGLCKVEYSDKSLSIYHDDITIKSILLGGKFIEWRQLLTIPPYLVSFTRTEFVSAVRRVLMFSDKQSNEIAVSISGTSLTISGEDINMKNNAEEVIKCSLAPQEITIGLNGNFCIEALNRLQSDEVFIFYSTYAKPILLRETETDENMCLLAPIMLLQNA